jgi:cysteinyl-tRNA synthetase
MELILKNSLTGELDTLNKTKKNGRLSFYTCGPTVYNDSHIGHARTFITFDIIRRILDMAGYDVFYGMNITDIDDKILNKVKLQHWNKLASKISNTNANTHMNLEQLETFLIENNFSEEEMTPSYEIYKEFITKQEKSFWDDMNALNNLSPTFAIRVSDVIDDITTYINELIKKQFAYVSNGSVYLDTKKYFEKFDKNCLCATHDSDGSNEIWNASSKDEYSNEKKDQKDFALWKKAKKYEISFNNVWDDTKGRPGWHIECSVMINKIFGGHLDIHGGGIDLKFPHHNNEYIQTTAYTENPDWVTYFLHSGHLNNAGIKMSQSLGNFTTIKQFLSKYTSRQARLLVMLHKWDGPLDLNDDTLKEMMELDNKIVEFFTHVEFMISKGSRLISKFSEADNELNIDTTEFTELINIAIKDNFNTPLIIKSLREYINKIYIYMSNPEPSKYLLENIYIDMFTFLDKLGLDYKKKKESNIDEELKQVIIDIREKLRNYTNTIPKENKQTKKEIYEITDWIRDVRLPQLNLTFQDTKNGTKIINI